jgi:hypothetical protein
VPYGAVSATFSAIGGAGAPGGDGGNGAGGAGAPGDWVHATFPVDARGPIAAGQMLYFEVGGNAPWAIRDGSLVSGPGGANGGGAGMGGGCDPLLDPCLSGPVSGGGGGGGGASDVRTRPASAGLSPDPRLLVAGGGGGGGGTGEATDTYPTGGDGGAGGKAGLPAGGTGGDGYAIFNYYGDSPTGPVSPDPASSGGGGSQSAGGSASSGGTPGAPGRGGHGGGLGGGGGGGYFGGGGGGSPNGGAGGGGGGSDYVAPGATAFAASAAPLGVQPSIEVTFVLAGADASPQKDRMSRMGVVDVRVVCLPGNVDGCVGTVKLVYGGATLGKAALPSTAPGQWIRVPLRLSAHARALLRRGTPLRARAIVSASDTNGRWSRRSAITLLP